MVASPPKNLPVVVIACRVFQGLFERYLPDGLAESVIYKDYGLHRLPKGIQHTLQDEIDNIEEESLIVLGYGLCGNGIAGVRSGKHTLLIPCVDDCIAMLLGSHQAYMQQFQTVPGTYYLSKGWLESGSQPLKEYQECIEKYGKENAEWIMDQQYRNYRRLVFVAHGRRDLEEYRPQAREVAQFCRRWNMEYEEILGSDWYVRRLVDVALDPAKADEDFVLIHPGGQIRLEQFLR